jgi:RNA polymerase sigma-70 factor (ECF subfamily)
VVRNKLRDTLARRAKQAQGSGDSVAQNLLEEQPDRDDAASALWDHEHERRLFAWAAELVRGEVQETTWRAFWLTAIESRAGKEVAQSLGISVAAVYLAKSRVMARLKQVVRTVETES